jgi:ribosomal protein S18 acetylase RimI-like enzyme
MYFIGSSLVDLGVGPLYDERRCDKWTASAPTLARDGRRRHEAPAPLVFIVELPDLTIRSASARDFTAILSLWRAAGIPPGVSDSEEGLAGLVAREPDGLLIAESQGEAIGTLIASWDGWRGSFYRLAVRSDSRRRGLGTALLHEGERRLRARGAVRLTAIVADDDPAAIDFWRAVGYERQSDRVRFIRHLKR